MKMKNCFWGCAVLGMHDAIVSTIGLVVGLVSADATQYVILLTGVIAAVAAGLSMTASEYLATRADGRLDVARYCGAATGVAYIFTAAMVLMPFVFIANSVLAMLLSYFVAIAIIFFFNYVKLCEIKTFRGTILATFYRNVNNLCGCNTGRVFNR